MKRMKKDTNQEPEHEKIKPRYTFKANYLFPPLIGLTGNLSMILVSYLLSNDYLPLLAITAYDYLNFLFTMQVLILLISFFVLGVMYLYDRENFKIFFRIGDVFAIAKPLKLLGIRENSTWKRVGPAIAIIVTSGTVVFMTISVIKMNGVVNTKVFTLFPLALIFSTTNAWSEEIFLRFTVVAGLHGRVKPIYKYWISAAITGIPHYFGTPGGPLGILMTGFLGWLLAKSVQETKGIFWACFIHFIADVVIFTAHLMILVGSL